MFAPVARIQGVEPHSTAGGRRVHKAPFAHINARVGRCFGGSKHDKVTGAQLVSGYRLAPAGQGCDRSRRQNSRIVFVNVGNQAAAVKTRVGRVATPSVGCSYQADSVQGDIVGLVSIEPRSGFNSGRNRPGNRLLWRAAATVKNGQCEKQAPAHLGNDQPASLGAAAGGASSNSSNALQEGAHTACDLPSNLRVPSWLRKRCLPHRKHDMVDIPE